MAVALFGRCQMGWIDVFALVGILFLGGLILLVLFIRFLQKYFGGIK